MSITKKLAAGVVVLGLALAGCGSQAPQQSAAPAPGGGSGSGEQVTLRFAWWGNDTRNRMTQEIIEAFEAENPDIKVQGEPGEFSGYWDKLATQVAASDAPDVIQMDDKYIA
ncbi:MAG TPA: extracellular solute-binding protein, partial [Propionibacterium sp.]|nr:extracellular solute-binding protein [Propionibacterium sp.]